jgi:hypothetical protein
MALTRLLSVFVLILVLAITASVAAFAARPGSGKWAGTVDDNKAKVTFKVGKRVKSFAVASLPVYCYGQGYTTKVFLVPSVKVRKGGSFKRAYKTRNDLGQVDGTLKVSGRFSTAGRASGKLDYNRGGCTSGRLAWHAQN